MILSIALIIYVCGVVYFLFFVGLPILFAGADCDHAFLLIAPLAVSLPFIWPLVLLWGATVWLKEKVMK